MSDADDHAYPGLAPGAGHDGVPVNGPDVHDDLAGGHGSGDDHGQSGPAEPLGPVDTQAWAATIGGAVLAIVVVVALYLAIAS